ncbi:MAG: hypothetical protein AAAB35_02940 [Phyllobacterium sp.]|uniref:hypothetical protein n=1 Tax=Phyllobacterium sp. TaxID=1871046 RepID=UPI0030F1684A
MDRLKTKIWTAGPSSDFWQCGKLVMLILLRKVARVTGLEPTTSGVTGQKDNPLNQRVRNFPQCIYNAEQIVIFRMVCRPCDILPATLIIAPMHITWQRTVIGGEPLRHDFCAEAEGIVIGRIMRFEHGELKDCWEYNFQLGHSGFRCGDDEGHADTRHDAIAAIKARFARFIATPHGEGGGLGLPPRRWLPGSYAPSTLHSNCLGCKPLK